MGQNILSSLYLSVLLLKPQVSVTAQGCRGWLGVVDTRYGVSQLASGRGARVYTCTYHVDVYRSRPTGAHPYSAQALSRDAWP